VRTLHDPRSGGEKAILDASAMVLRFPAPKSATGEDVLELHVHGGPATVKAVLSAIPECSSPSGAAIRYAEPGEFTKRAFVNDRLDLAQVESLGETLDAETEQQRRVAVRGNSGALGRTYDKWREQLLLARGEIEALIDFSEDQHFDESPAELLANVTALVDGILASIEAHDQAGQRSELLRNGIRIALLGPPNAGKSSLMNLIVGREASIVSAEAGTTRDVIEASLDIRGYLCTFADTAGFRSENLANSSDSLIDENQSPLGAVEQEGIRRAKSAALSADIVVVLASIERSPQGVPFVRADPEALQLASRAPRHMLIINKADQAATGAKSEESQILRKLAADFAQMAETAGCHRAVPLLISCAAEAGADAAAVGQRRPRAAFTTLPTAGATGRSATSTPTATASVQDLVERLAEIFAGMTAVAHGSQDLLAVTARQRGLLRRCREHLDDFAAEAALGDDADIVLAAEHLRYAGGCLAKITGRGEAGDTEEVLGVIFEK
jgi:tRNA modification GTPase